MAAALAATAVPAAAAPAAAAPPETVVRDGQQQVGLPALENRYVVVLDADPVVAYEGDVPGLPGTAIEDDASLDPHAPAVRAYVDHLEREQREAQDAAGVRPDQVTAEYAFALSGFAAELTPAQVDRLSRQEGVAAVLRDRLLRPQTDNTPAFLGLDEPRTGPWAQGYDGEGVVVAVIDTGIWPEHPSFTDDGTLPAPPPETALVPCEFGNTAHNPDDAPFACNNKLVGARDMRITYKQVVGPETYDSARDDDGHGTHTASTAAGNRGVAAEIFDIPRGEVSGVAPRAHVLAYKALGELGGVTSDLAAAVDQAVADGADVINYSIGGGAGPIGADDLAFLLANDAGVFTATSAGNDGPGASTVGSPAVWPWMTSVGASTQNRAFEGAVRLGDGSVFPGASVTAGVDEHRLVDAEDAGSELCELDALEPALVEGNVVLCRRGTNARVEKSQAVFEAGGVGMVLYDVTDEASLVTDNHWVPSVHVGLTAGLAIKAYIDAAGADATAAIEAGRRVEAPGSVMADFSSRGENAVAADVIVPDVTAPGVNILAGNTPTPVLGAPGQLFQSISGTSMSSPHVAGVMALLKQAHPDWTPAIAKSALMTTARQNVVKEDGETPADPFDMGAGHIVPSLGGDGLTDGRGSARVRNTAFDPGLAYDADLTDYLGFLCSADPSVFADAERTCGALEAAGVATDPRNLNLASIGVSQLAGSVTVTRTVTSVAESGPPISYRAKVEAPAGYRVDVEPRKITVGPGESATFTVTISNRRAALDEWTFGSLTWVSDRYEVRSPIAVRAVALTAPDAVTGTGTTGTADIPVQFGYTGEYDAQAHGLVPRTATPGTVAQDPDQTFDPADPAGTTAHEFTLTDVTLARWRLTHATPDVDLDVYLVNSAGELVASSTNGGTNELIELRSPPDDTYTLYVHGWQTITPDVEYVLESWLVPGSTDGSLQVVSAPGSATIGATGVVQVGWAGLAVGEEYLGAVSHLRGDELLQLTAVEVTG